MPTARTNATELFFRRSETNGPDVVLAHGLAASHAFWYPRIAVELERFYRVTVYDLRGHGRSAMPPTGYSLASMVADLHGLMDTLGIVRPHLIGHSFGGVVALEFALSAPDRIASVTVADARLKAIEARRQASSWDGFRASQLKLAQDGVRVDSQETFDHRLLERVARSRVRRRPPNGSPGGFTPFGGWGSGRRSSQRWLQLLAETSAHRDFDVATGPGAAALRALTSPVCAIYGDRSFALPSGRALARVMPNCRLVVLPRAGHFHPAVEPSAFLAALRPFLMSLDRWRPPASV